MGEQPPGSSPVTSCERPTYVPDTFWPRFAKLAKNITIHVEAGCDVAINYLRNKGPAHETVAAIQALGRKALLWKGNVAEMESHPAMFEFLEKEFGRLDILISNAASGVIKPAMELTPRHWSWTARWMRWPLPNASSNPS